MKKLLLVAFIALLATGTMAFRIPLAYAQETYIGVHPQHIFAFLRNTLTVKINVSSAIPFVSYQFYLYWNRTYINATSLTDTPPTEWDPFFVGAGLQWNYNSTHGRITRGAVDTHLPIRSVSGNFTVATISFMVIKSPQLPEDICLKFDYDNTFLGDSSGKMITPYYVYDGWIHTTKVGDFGGGSPPEFFKYDGNVDWADVALFIQCYKKQAPPEAMYLADLGGPVGVRPTFFAYDGKIDWADVALFIVCYKGQGPDT